MDGFSSGVMSVVPTKRRYYHDRVYRRLKTWKAIRTLTIEAEDALIAALKSKLNHPEALISYVRKSNRRGDRRNPHRKE